MKIEKSRIIRIGTGTYYFKIPKELILNGDLKKDAFYNLEATPTGEVYVQPI